MCVLGGAAWQKETQWIGCQCAAIMWTKFVNRVDLSHPVLFLLHFPSCFLCPSFLDFLHQPSEMCCSYNQLKHVQIFLECWHSSTHFLSLSVNLSLCLFWISPDRIRHYCTVCLLFLWRTVCESAVCLFICVSKIKWHENEKEIMYLCVVC